MINQRLSHHHQAGENIAKAVTGFGLRQIKRPWNHTDGLGTLPTRFLIWTVFISVLVSLQVRYDQGTVALLKCALVTAWSSPTTPRSSQTYYHPLSSPSLGPVAVVGRSCMTAKSFGSFAPLHRRPPTSLFCFVITQTTSDLGALGKVYMTRSRSSSSGE